MATFPTYPILLFDGFAEEPESAVLRTEMESGVKQAMIRSRALVPRTVVYLLQSATDFQNFKIWVRDSIARGAAWFDWTDPVNNTTKKAQIVRGQIKYKPRNPQLESWTASFSLETWDG